MSHLESGSVVWVRLGQAWWPGTITTVAKCPPEFVEGIRKMPIAIVKFFHENEFQDVHKSEHICPYNCDRKEEFIRRGQYTNKNQSHGEVDLLAKFEADVVTAEKLTGGDMNILQTLDEVADACSPSYNIQSSPTNPHLELDYTLMSHKLVASSDSLCSTCVANDDYLSRPQRNLWPEPGEGVSKGHKARTQGDSDSCKVRNPHSNDKDQSNYKKTFDQISSQLNEQKMSFFNDHVFGAPNTEISELEFKNRQSDSQLKSPRQDYDYCYVDDQGDMINLHVNQKSCTKENQEKDSNDLKQYIVDKENLNDVDMYGNSENSVHYDTVKDLHVNISGSKQKQKQTFRYDSDKTNIHGNTHELGHICDIDREVGQVDDEHCSTKADRQELCHTTEVEEGKMLCEEDSGRKGKDQEQIHSTKGENMCFMMTNHQQSQCDKPFQAHLANLEPQTDNHLKDNKYLGKKFLSDVHVLDIPCMNTDVYGHSYRISEEQNCCQTQKKNGLLHRGHDSATQEERHNSSQEHSQSLTHKPSVTNTDSQPEEFLREQHDTVYSGIVEISMLTESSSSEHIAQDLHKSVNDRQQAHCYPANGDHTGELSGISSRTFSDETSHISHFVDEVHSELMMENSLKITSLIPKQSTDSKDLVRNPGDPTSPSGGSNMLFRNLNNPHSSHTVANAPSGSATSTKETNSTNIDSDVADFEGFEAEDHGNINAFTQVLINIFNNKKEYREKKCIKKARKKRIKSNVGKARGTKRTKVKEENVGSKNMNIPVQKAEKKKTKGTKGRVGRKNSKCALVNDSVMDKKPSLVEKKSDSRKVQTIKSTCSNLQIGYAKVKRVRGVSDSSKLPDKNTKKSISNDRERCTKTKSSRKVRTDSRESRSPRQSERKRKSSEMDNLLNRENKIKRNELPYYESDKSKERMQKKQFRERKPRMQPKKKVTRRKGKSRNQKADIHGSGTRKNNRSQTDQEYSSLETEEDLPDLTVAPLTKEKSGPRFKTGDLVWSLYRGKWWPSFIQKVFPITKKASIFFIGCKEGNGIRVDLKNMKTFRCGDVPSGVNQSENGFTEALQLTESYCQLRDHGKSISVQEFFSMPPEDQDALIIVSLTPKEDPSLSTQSLKRKLEEDMKWERTPESHKDWYEVPIKGTSHGESNPIANQELSLSARDRMKIQSAMKARRKENERLLKFMKSASCMDHLWQIFNGEKFCERHNMYQDEITRRTLLWSGIGPFQLDQDDDQILSVIDFLSTELSRKRPHFRLAHDYTFRVWMPEAIKEALRVIKKVPEDELELALDEGYKETKTEKIARRLEFT